MKVVINTSIGGFSLSKAAFKFMGIKWDGYGFCSSYARHFPKVVECVESLGQKAAGKYCYLKIVEIPDNIEYEIHAADDGTEYIAEKHRKWR